MVAESSSRVSVPPELASAIEGWGRGVFGAPRRLAGLVTAIEVRDDVIHRVLTDVVRRDLREERTFATEQQPSTPRIPLSQVDPFAGTLETLKANTLHIAVCVRCSSSGLDHCPTCRGSLVVACSGCGGAGKFRNPRTNRLNKCKECKGSGSAACEVCRDGKVSCQACRGSGYQRVWLVYTETRQPRVVVYADPHLVVANPRFREARILSSKEIEAFSLEADVHADGPLPVDELSLEYRAFVEQELATLDRRLERVIWQQYMRLTVVRRDIIYQMCGTSGTLELSGRPLVVDSTLQATHPIRRRLILWPVFFAIFGTAGAIVAGSAMGRADYFGPSNQVVGMLWLGAATLSVPWIGGLLRAWRPLLRIRGLRPIELGLGIAWALIVLAIGLVGVFTRPDIREVEEALAAEDVERARIVLDALIELEGESPRVLEVEDAVLMAEANAADAAERLAKLDAIASHHGDRASEAEALARGERLAEVRALVSAGKADEAIAAIEHDFAATWRDDSEIAEERARAEELRAEQCSDDACRLLARRAAWQAHDTPERAEAVEQLRERLMASLAIETNATTLTQAERVRASDEVATLAGQVLASEVDDEVLMAAAKAAKVWAADERAVVPILGADLDTLRALFPGIHQSPTDIPSVSLEGAELFFSLDAKGKCRGVYAVGPTGHRELDASEWSAEKILSQALGQPVKLLPPKKASDISSTWKEGKTKIVVRWRGSVPIELRIGNATP